MTRLHSSMLVLLLCGGAIAPAARADDETIAILRDDWGVPYIFADSDEGACYGLGYATAEDRGFQMMFSLRLIQGRSAEVLGEVSHVSRRESTLDHDRKMRTFGFYRAAQRTAAGLDADSRRLLQAYSDGVNRYFESHQDQLHPLFRNLELAVEMWTPADCLASWWHLGQFFATDGTRDLIAGRQNPRRQAMVPAELQPMPPDDDPAVVKRSDLDPAWIERVDAYARRHGLAENTEGPPGPQFSHAWVVGGQRTTTGAAVLVSDPQTPVRNPSLFYEFHLQGQSFRVRGIGVPGSPLILIGFNEQVAWGVTALGADQADLFQLDTHPEHKDQYRWEGQWRPMQRRSETIRVKGAQPIEWTVRETHWGPVATPFCFAQAGEREVALKRIPICEDDQETIQAAVAMWRSHDVFEFDAALAAWRFPSVNVVFGDRQGNIGYRVAAAIPLRSAEDSTAGRAAQPGERADQDWRGFIPHDLLPGVINPASGFVYSGNHRPVESWYPLPVGAMTGAGGDTLRSWRLRELLSARQQWTPEDVLAVHYDAVNPARRDLVRLGLHLRDVLHRELPPDALQALAHLEPWYRAGASMALTQPGAELAAELNTFFRFQRTDLAYVYGGGESGLAYFLKTLTARIESEPQTDLSPLEQAFIAQSLAEAWEAARRKYGDRPQVWNEQARRSIASRRLGYFEGLHGFPSLDPQHDLRSPPLRVADGGTIHCQTSQSYTQWVPLGAPDQARTLLPMGQSERPDGATRTSTLALWSAGELHPAPLSRAAAEAIGAKTSVQLVRSR